MTVASRRPISACRSIPTRRRRRSRASKIIAPVPRFSARTILIPEVVQPFLEGLAGHASAIAGSRSGDREGEDRQLRRAGGSRRDAGRRTESRVRARPRRAQQGRERASGGVVPADAEGRVGFSRRGVLSRRHARRGRPRQAKRSAPGRWRCSAKIPAAVYPVLVDALLRTGDGRMALDILEEAPSAWANDNERLKREAIALAMLGDYSGALPKLKDQLDNTKNDDQPLLFVAIQVLLQDASAGQEPESRQPAAVPQLRRAAPEAGRTGSRHRRNVAARGTRTIDRSTQGSTLRSRFQYRPARPGTVEPSLGLS